MELTDRRQAARQRRGAQLLRAARGQKAAHMRCVRLQRVGALGFQIGFVVGQIPPVGIERVHARAALGGERLEKAGTWRRRAFICEPGAFARRLRSFRRVSSPLRNKERSRCPPHKGGTHSIISVAEATPTPPAPQEGRVPKLSVPPSAACLLVLEQSRLRSLAARLGEAEMTEGVRRQEPSARRPLHKAELDEIGLDDVLDRVARLRERGGDGLDPDRPAAELDARSTSR